MHGDREHNLPGSVISRLGNRAKRALACGRAGWNDEEAWNCAFCGGKTSQQQFWCSHCSRCLYDGEVLSPREIGLHWDRHLPLGDLVYYDDEPPRRHGSLPDAYAGPDDS